MKSFSYIDETGDTTVFEGDAKIENDKLVVYFIKSVFSDGNKWKEKQVLT